MRKCSAIFCRAATLITTKRLVGFGMHGNYLHVLQNKDATVVGVFLQKIFHVVEHRGKDVKNKTCLGPSNIATAKFGSGVSSLAGEAVCCMRIHFIH